METPEPPHVWQAPTILGESEALKGFGGIVSPLLAGFSLTAVVTLLTAGGRIRLRDPAITAFATATVLFLFTIEFSFTALRHSASPADRLSWYPEATRDPEALQDLRYVQALDNLMVRRYQTLVRRFHNTGILLFIAGLVMLLIPKHESGWLTAAAAIAATAGLLEFLWLISVGRSKALAPARWLLGPIRGFLPGYDELQSKAVTKWKGELEHGAKLESVLQTQPSSAAAAAAASDGSENREGL